MMWYADEDVMYISLCGCNKILFSILCHEKEMFIQYIHLLAICMPALVVKTTIIIFQ